MITLASSIEQSVLRAIDDEIAFMKTPAYQNKLRKHRVKMKGKAIRGSDISDRLKLRKITTNKKIRYGN